MGHRYVSHPIGVALAVLNAQRGETAPGAAGSCPSALGPVDSRSALARDAAVCRGDAAVHDGSTQELADEQSAQTDANLP